MSQVTGFTEYDGNGKPFMGLMFTDGTVQVKVYLAHRETAARTARELSENLQAMAGDLVKMPDKIVAAEGVNDAALRKH